jgi:protocatechuate 3,4-dioxygenase beta subunit
VVRVWVERDEPLPVVAHVIARQGLEEHARNTDEQGRARFPGLLVGKVHFLVTAPGWHMRVNLPEEVRETGGEAIVYMERGAILRGRVVTAAEGRPVPNALVDAHGGGVLGDDNVSGGLESYGSVLTDAEGRFLLTGLPFDFIVTLRVVVRGYRRAEMAMRLQPVEGERDPVEVRLEPGGWLRGEVVDADGAALRGASVYVVPENHRSLREDPTDRFLDGDRALEATSDAHGKFVIPGLGFDARWCALALLEGHARSEEVCGIVVSAARPEAQVSLALRLPGRVVIHVREEEGQEPTAERAHKGSWDGRRVHSDAAGTFRFDDVPPGLHWLRVEVEECIPFSVPIEVRGGATVERTVRADPGVAIAGVLRDESGNPRPDEWITFRRVNTWGLQGVTCDPEGRFRVAGLIPGTYEMSARSSDDGVLGTVTAPAADVQLVVPTRQRVVAKFTHPTGGAAPEDGWVLAYRESGGGYGTRQPWNDGTVVWEVPPGKRRLVYAARGYAPWERVVEVRRGEPMQLGVIPLEEGAVVSGTIEDDEGRPVRGALIELDDSSGEVATSAPDGTFQLAHVPRRAFDFSVRAEGFVEAELRGDAPPSPLRIVLTRGAVLVGSVRYVSGGPPGEVSVHVNQKGSGARAGNYDWPTPDSRGDFRSQLMPGTYQVVVEQDGNRVLTAEVILEKGKETPLLLTLPPR